jgi:hypothetical protein
MEDPETQTQKNKKKKEEKEQKNPKISWSAKWKQFLLYQFLIKTKTQKFLKKKYLKSIEEQARMFQMPDDTFKRKEPLSLIWRDQATTLPLDNKMC